MKEGLGALASLPAVMVLALMILAGLIAMPSENGIRERVENHLIGVIDR